MIENENGTRDSYGSLQMLLMNEKNIWKMEETNRIREMPDPIQLAEEPAPHHSAPVIPPLSLLERYFEDE